MGRAAFAYRDLDEELVSFADDHAYVSHASPPGKALSESTILKQFNDHQRSQRRRKLLGVGLFAALVLVTLLPMLLAARDATEAEDHALSLVLSAPYKGLRARETARASESEPVDEDDMVLQPAVGAGPSVGDPDPHDDLINATEEQEQAQDHDDAHTDDETAVHRSVEADSPARLAPDWNG
ncbi:hypothetical protein ATCC90586_003322 [Pythium insidiosum]|nr:hypothetical protein ATCC90586_003322 [Pythium insidiosum]